MAFSFIKSVSDAVEPWPEARKQGGDGSSARELAGVAQVLMSLRRQTPVAVEGPKPEKRQAETAALPPPQAFVVLVDSKGSPWP